MAWTSYLIDSSFIQVDRSFIRELSRYLLLIPFSNLQWAHTELRSARYSRNRTRFVTLPADLDSNSSNIALVNASLASGLYPKVLGIDFANRQMRTITNNQPAAFHPSSVNFRKNVFDFGIHYLSYFTLM
jgi:ATP-dependent RNA helicase DHX29